MKMIDPTGHEVRWEPTDLDPYEEELDSGEDKLSEEDQIESLKDLVGAYLPKLVEEVQRCVSDPHPPETFELTPDLYEDKFTPKFHFHAYTLLGMAVKYVMIHGLQCQIGE